MKYIIIILGIFFVTSIAYNPGAYEKIINKKVDFSLLSDDDKLFEFLWNDFHIPYDEKIQKVMVFISTTKSSLGKWTGAFGTTTNVPLAYFTMSIDMRIAFTTNKGSITWKIDSETQNNIRRGDTGRLVWCVWDIDCNDFTIDKVVVFTDKYKGGYYDDNSTK